MTQSLEIEFKNLLTKMEYKKIINHFHLEESLFFQQENHYFDTLNFDLKENNSALRIRKKGNQYELTLKQPAPAGLLETNQVLTEAEATAALVSNEIPKGQVADLLIRMNVSPKQLLFFGTLRTKRAEWNYEDGLLVLDYSSYLNTEDYELEYEVKDPTIGLTKFIALLSFLQIPIRNTESKIMRFYLQKYKALSSDQSTI